MDQAGSPQESVSLTVDEHWAFMQRARHMDLSLWNRMADYYEDADYEVEEVARLTQETERLQRVFSEVDLAAKLREIVALLQVATSRRNMVSAIAD